MTAARRGEEPVTGIVRLCSAEQETLDAAIACIAAAGLV